jgi:ParB-like chromosome segregation protein Spo0J
MSRSIHVAQGVSLPYNHHQHQFLSYLKQERGFADATIANRERSLKLFLGWLVAEDVPLSTVSKTLPARQIIRFAPWMIERSHLDLPAVHRAIRLVHRGRRDPSRMPNYAQTLMFCNPEEQLGES